MNKMLTGRFLCSSWLFGVVLCVLPVMVGAKSYSIEDFNAELYLKDDGNYRVTETIRFRFQGGDFTYAYRTIPLEAMQSISNVSVTSDDTSVEKVERDQGLNDFELRWHFPERQGTATFRVQYRVEGALIATPSRNRIEWDAVGDQWTVPLKNVDATISLPGEIADRASELELRPRGFISRDQDRWRIDYDGGVVPAKTGLRLIAEFPRTMDGRQAPMGESALARMIGLTVLLFVLGMTPGLRKYWRWRAWRSAGQADSGGDPAVDPYEAVVLLAGRHGARRGYITALFRMAGDGHVTLYHRCKGWGPFRSTKLQFRQHSEQASLELLEQDLSRAMAHADSMEELARRMRSTPQGLRHLRSRLIEQGLMVDWREASNHCILLAMLMVFGVGACLLAGALSGAISKSIPLAGLLAGLGAGWGAAAGQRYPLSDAGVHERHRIRRYLEGVRERLEAQAQKRPQEALRTFLQLLPWLMVDSRTNQQWLKRFSRRLGRATTVPVVLPEWLVVEGEQPADAAEAVENVLMTTITRSAAAVAPGAAGAAGAGGAGGGGGGARGGGGGAG